MRRLLWLPLLIIAAPLAALAQAPASAYATTGTPHGISLTWTDGTSGDTNSFGAAIWRCTGTISTCVPATSGTWIQVNSTLVPSTTLSYLDPAAGLSVNTSYVYAIQNVDTAGNKSPFSPTVAVSVGPSFPANPAAPTTPSGTVQ